MWSLTCFVVAIVALFLFKLVTRKIRGKVLDSDIEKRNVSHPTEPISQETSTDKIQNASVPSQTIESSVHRDGTRSIFSQTLVGLYKAVIIVIVVVIIMLALSRVQEQRRSSDIREPIMRTPQKVSIDFNFLVKGDNPKIFINSAWEELPISEDNALSLDKKFFAGCGGYGDSNVYVYNLQSKSLQKIYADSDPHFCTHVYFDARGRFIVETDKGMDKPLGEQLIFDGSTYELISQSAISRDEIREHIKTTAGLHEVFDEVCRDDQTLCAQQDATKGIVLINKVNGQRIATPIKRSLPIALKGNILFFAVFYQESPFDKVTMHIPIAQAIMLDYHLYAYDIATGMAEKILNSFRPEYDEIVFF